MKPFPSIFCIIFFSLLLLVNLSYARKDVGDYWKNMMQNQGVPEAIKDLVVQDSPSQLSEAEKKKDRFVRDFDIKPNREEGGKKDEGVFFKGYPGSSPESGSEGRTIGPYTVKALNIASGSEGPRTEERGKQ
ncbi:hypothetical protein K1719_001066 [Acacia pycnantha]|nr:hypothetical protein K1719_001066 [Acacia pycnantha]